jgi:hypothetical protein
MSGRDEPATAVWKREVRAGIAANLSNYPEPACNRRDREKRTEGPSIGFLASLPPSSTDSTSPQGTVRGKACLSGIDEPHQQSWAVVRST